MPTAEQQNAKKWHKTLTSLCTVFGGIFLVVGLAGLADIIDLWGYWFDWGEFLTALAQTIGGGAALAMGLRMKQARKLERQLDKIVGTRDNIPLDELFAAAGIDADRGRAAVERAIDHGYFGADAYIDNRTGTLVVRALRPAAQTRRARTRTGSRGSVCRPAAPAPAGQRYHPRPGDDGQDLPAGGCQRPHLRTGKKDPDKKAQLQKFMDYYLPTALKLLNTYAQLSAQDVQGTNITEAKQSIERSMDLLITAFENQLDKLFASDALDVSTDIAALEGMLNLDGLTGGDFAPRS